VVRLPCSSGGLFVITLIEERRRRPAYAVWEPSAHHYTLAQFVLPAGLKFLASNWNANGGKPEGN
jgi:hypothetical protein